MTASRSRRARAWEAALAAWLPLGAATALAGPLLALAACHRDPTESADRSATAAPSSSAAAPSGSSGPVRLKPEMIDAVVNPMHLPPYAGATGTLEGTVVVTGPDAPEVPHLDVHACPAALDTYGKLFRAGPARADGARPLADAVVVVAGYSGFYLPEKSEVVSVTIGAQCAYPARAIAMTFGQRLEVANDSPIAFAPYLEGQVQFSVLVAPPKHNGPPVAVLPTRADHFALKDQLQGFVSGDVYVLRQPLHAVTDLGGHFRIDGVPAGVLKAAALISAFPGSAAKDITVPAGGTTSVEFVLPYSGLTLPVPAHASIRRPAVPPPPAP